MRIYSGVPVSYDLLKLLLKGLSKPPETAQKATGHGRGEISWGTPWTAKEHYLQPHWRSKLAANRMHLGTSFHPACLPINSSVK